MDNTELVMEYFSALQNNDGELARSLFQSNGTIDDLKGNHHVGGDAIQALVGNARGLTVKFSSGVIHESPRATVYGSISLSENRELLQLEEGDSLKVRWVFTISNGKIDYLCNSNIMVFPQDRIDSV